ncbi:MAG: hypothetical protein RR561_00735 [Peptostreptococcus sp.]|uniref:hypothetical protein n=1 Tax=Peptostreptococcus sp. TaxID=1262 RepID=UPI002FC8209F
MRWVSDKVDFKSSIVFSIAILGFGFIIKGIVDIIKSMLKLNFTNWTSVVTRGYFFTIAVVIVGTIFIFYKMYTEPEAKNQEESNRRQLFYKMIMLLMLLATMLSYSKPVFTVVLFTTSSINLIMLGFIIAVTFKFLKKRL